MSSTAMHYRPLGQTGTRVSAVILGCGNFGGLGSAKRLVGKGVDQKGAAAIMDTALDMGINCFDTSNTYGGGASESYVGAWLKAKGSAVRDRLLISTKVYHPVGDDPNDYGLSRRHIVSQVEASLRRLNIDYLDMYLWHAPDPLTPLEETLRTLDDLIRAGKIRYIGSSGAKAWMVMKALAICDRRNYSRLQWVQDSYSLIDRALDAEMVPLCRDQGLGITPFSPLAGGLLVGNYRQGEPIPTGSRVDAMPEIYSGMLNEQTFLGLEHLRAFAEERGAGMAAVALAWLLAQPHVTAPIVGPRRAEHLAPVREALSLNLSAEDCATLASFFSGQSAIRRISLLPTVNDRLRAAG